MGIAESIFDGFRAARDVKALVEGVAYASVGDVLPVVALHVVVEVEVLIVAEERGEGRDLRRVVVVFQQCELILPPCVVAGLEHVHLLCDFLPAIVGVVAHADLSLLSFLCGDEDDAIGATATIDSGGGGILEHGDVLDVGSGDVADVVHGETVDDEQRVVALRDGATAAHADLHCGIG